jgi:preprotein translocase subunit SecE
MGGIIILTQVDSNFFGKSLAALAKVVWPQSHF